MHACILLSYSESTIMVAQNLEDKCYRISANRKWKWFKSLCCSLLEINWRKWILPSFFSFQYLFSCCHFISSHSLHSSLKIFDIHLRRIRVTWVYNGGDLGMQIYPQCAGLRAYYIAWWQFHPPSLHYYLTYWPYIYPCFFIKNLCIKARMHEIAYS